MPARIPLPGHLRDAPFRYDVGLAAGLGRTRLTGPDLVRPFHGVRMVSSGPLDIETLCRAYSVKMAPRAFFSFITAAALWRVPLPLALERHRSIHVSVPDPERAPGGRGVIGHRVRTASSDVRVLRGLRLSSPARMWCELASELDVPDLVAVGDHLVHWRSPVASVGDLAAALHAYPGRRGRRRLAHSLPLLDDRAESPQESRLRVILLTQSLDGFLVNHEVMAEGRRFRADFAFPKERVIIEYQGDHHRAQWRKDMTRRLILTSAGWLVLEVNADDLADPAELARRIRLALRTRSAGQ